MSKGSKIVEALACAIEHEWQQSEEPLPLRTIANRRLVCLAAVIDAAERMSGGEAPHTFMSGDAYRIPASHFEELRSALAQLKEHTDDR